MRKNIKRILCLVAAFALTFSVGALAACGDGGDDKGTHTHTYASVWSHDENYHWHAATCEHANEIKDKAPHTFGDGEVCTVCNYKKEEDTPPGETILGAKYIVPHTEGESVTYIMEAENTGLGGKSGVGYSSGDLSEADLVVGVDGASNGMAVNYLYTQGISVNFIVVSDREVKDAKLTIRVAAEFMDMQLDPYNYAIRVDPVQEEDLADYRNGGAWGRWDDYFLNYYSAASKEEEDESHKLFKGYYIDEWECEEIHLDARYQQPMSKPTDFREYDITLSLTLYKGVTSISFITDNDTIPKGAGGNNLGTMRAIAPIFDCIKITTSAQLGLYNPVGNKDAAENACRIEK